jgi:TonB family protein
VNTRLILCLTAVLLALPSPAQSSDWLKSPRPKFPRSALQRYSEGSVRLRVVVAQDGTAREVIVVKSSGDPALDDTAQKAVLRWKMKPHAIKPADLARGREVIIDFKQEAPVAASYPDGVGAAFTDERGIITASKGWQIWMYAPFPSYPMEVRRAHRQGTVWIGLRIGKDGKPEDVRIVQSSGYPVLDQSAMRAVVLWIAHKQYAVLKITFTVRFELRRP